MGLNSHCTSSNLPTELGDSWYKKGTLPMANSPVLPLPGHGAVVE